MDGQKRRAGSLGGQRVRGLGFRWAGIFQLEHGEGKSPARFLGEMRLT
jgi:hypothetical protein